MKKILTLVFFVTFSVAGAKDISFNVERMITDFNGITTNGSNTICYGNYGIMTYSLDRGSTWNQLNIGDRYNIKEMDTSGSDFIGLTEFSLIKSTNNGLDWTNKIISEEPNLIDFTLNNNSMFILSKNSILVSDINLNVEAQPLLILDSAANYSEIETDGANLYIIKDNRVLLTYNLSADELTTKDLISEIDCNSCTKISEIKTSENKIYIRVSKEYTGGTLIPYFLRSSDIGKSWQKLIVELPTSLCYNIIDDQIYFFKPLRISKGNYTFFDNGYFKVDSSNNELDTTYITRVNPEQKITRRVKYSSKITYKDFIVLDNNIIIAVGTDKLISVSNNNGKSFEFKSIYQGSYFTNDRVSIITDSLIYVINNHAFYKTKDGGITWLPQKYTDYNANLTRTVPYYYYLDSNGNGFAQYGDINTSDDSSALVTYDYGENFIKTNRPEYTIPNYSYFRKRGIDLGDKFIFILNPVKHTADNYSYTIVQYNKSLKFLDSIKLNTGKIVNTKKVKDDKLIAMILKATGTNEADSNGVTENYSYNYYLIQSKDHGKTWAKLKDSIPVTQPLTKRFDGTYYYRDAIMKESIIFNNWIIYPTINNIIYRYNFVNNKFDSIPYPGDLDYYNNLALFNLKSNLLTVSNTNANTIYYTKEQQDFENTTWDSLAGEDIFAKWEQYDFRTKKLNKDAILDAKMLSNSFGYLIIGKSYDSGSQFNPLVFTTKLVKITPKTHTSVIVDDFNTEQERTFLWNSQPYPMPGKSIIQSKLYWNDAYSLSEMQLSVYDVNGNKLNNPDISINAVNTYSGLLKLDCTDMSSGIYFIQASLNEESISFPVIISK